jgi:hypothetical protein
VVKLFLTHPQVQILAERVPASGITFEQESDGTIIYSEGDGRDIAITARGDVKRVVEINEDTIRILSNDPDAARKLMANDG